MTWSCEPERNILIIKAVRMAFKQGDVVVLNSGGPEMTVQNIVGVTTTKQQTVVYAMGHYKEGDLVVQWFDKGELKTGVFSPDQVRLSNK